MEEMQEWAKGINVTRQPGDPSDIPFFSLQHWYPRVCDEWARDKDGAVPDDLYSMEEVSLEIHDVKEPKFHYKSLLPQFASEYALHGEPRCANELSFRFYGSGDHLAEVLPRSAGQNLLRTISGLTSIGEWRIGRNGLVACNA